MLYLETPTRSRSAWKRGFITTLGFFALVLSLSIASPFTKLAAAGEPESKLIDAQLNKLADKLQSFLAAEATTKIKQLQFKSPDADTTTANRLTQVLREKLVDRGIVKGISNRAITGVVQIEKVSRRQFVLVVTASVVSSSGTAEVNFRTMHIDLDDPQDLQDYLSEKLNKSDDTTATETSTLLTARTKPAC